MTDGAPRVLIDTNVFVSYLLAPRGRLGTIEVIVEAALARRFTLLVSQELLDELSAVLTTSGYLRQRIPQELTENFLTAIRAIAALLPAFQDAVLPAVVGDPKDDYLLAYALVGQADYLVSGDQDLLALGTVDRLRIISPLDFMRELGLETPPEGQR